MLHYYSARDALFPAPSLSFSLLLSSFLFLLFLFLSFSRLLSFCLSLSRALASPMVYVMCKGVGMVRMNMRYVCQMYPWWVCLYSGYMRYEYMSCA